MKNIFLRDVSYYKRKIDPKRDYLEQTSFFISKMKGISEEQAKQSIVERIKTSGCYRDPEVAFYHRPNYEDSHLDHLKLSEYIKTINTEKLTISPSFTCYTPVNQKESFLVKFTDNNTSERAAYKKLSAKYEAEKDYVRARHYFVLQDNKKNANNTLTGLFFSSSSLIRNPTGHSSLTSTVRGQSSISNACNERLISGNRHYRTPEVTLNNIIFLAKEADKEEIEKAMEEYSLVYPTIEETYECIYSSAKLYWSDERQSKIIKQFISKLEPYQLASIVYTGDLFHLRKHNESLIRQFITEISKKVTDQHFDNPSDIIKKVDETIVNFAHEICIDEVTGINKDYSKITIEAASTVAATCLNIQNVVSRYRNLIFAFLLTESLPPSKAYIRDQIRKTVVHSDTDSTMFAVDEWVMWYFGHLRFDALGYSISGAIKYIATSCIAHALALYSANLGVCQDKLFLMEMKPEYMFPVFALTENAKHYFTSIKIKEGSVFEKLKKEIKGVHLINSAAPPTITKNAEEMMLAIIDDVMKDQSISINKYLNWVINLEEDIKKSAMEGNITYLDRLTIDDLNTYAKGEDESNYFYYITWNMFFGDKYERSPNPPYPALKFPLTTSSQKKIKNWADSLDDKNITNNIMEWLKKYDKDRLNLIYIPLDYLQNNPIPNEILKILDIERLVIKRTSTHRLVLGALGVQCKSNLMISSIICK